RIERADDRFLRFHATVLRCIQNNSELVQICANRFAKRRPVFSNARGEHQRVQAVQLQVKRTDPTPRLINKNVQRELRLAIALPSLVFNVAKIVIPTRQRLQSRLLAQQLLGFVQTQILGADQKRQGE